MYNANMPYNYTHALLGVACRRKVLPETECIIAAYPEEFLIGTMGPDPYYGDALPKPLGRPCRAPMADLLHQLEGLRLFSTMADLSIGNPVCQAYTLGFACHFFLDWTTHPYIYARYPGRMHTPSEIAMDPLMVARLDDNRFLRPPKQVYKTVFLQELDGLHCALTEALFSVSDPGAYARAFKKWIRINTLSWDPKDNKYRIFGKLMPKGADYLVSPARGMERDWLNLARLPWSAAQGETASFPDLFLQGLEIAAEGCDVLSAVMSGKNTEAALTMFAGRNMNAERLV